MSRLVFSVGLNGYHVGYRTCIETQREYARRIGADYYIATKPFVRYPALAAWLKLTFMSANLIQGYEEVAYIDADCLVRPHAPDFSETMVATGSIFMAKGRSGRLNSGVIFARSSSESKLFLDRVLASATESIPLEARANLRFENGNIIYVDEKYGGVTEIDQVWNNSSIPEMDDYIRHFTGPMKAEFRAPITDQIQYRLLKSILPRPKKAPQRRSQQFVDALNDLTDRVLNDMKVEVLAGEDSLTESHKNV